MRRYATRKFENVVIGGQTNVHAEKVVDVERGASQDKEPTEIKIEDAEKK